MKPPQTQYVCDHAPDKRKVFRLEFYTCKCFFICRDCRYVLCTKKTQDFIPALKYVLQYSEHYPFTLLFSRSLISDCLFGDSDNIPGNHGICLRRYDGNSLFGDSDNILGNRHFVIIIS